MVHTIMVHTIINQPSQVVGCMAYCLHPAPYKIQSIKFSTFSRYLRLNLILIKDKRGMFFHSPDPPKRIPASRENYPAGLTCSRHNPYAGSQTSSSSDKSNIWPCDQLFPGCMARSRDFDTIACILDYLMFEYINHKQAHV